MPRPKVHDDALRARLLDRAGEILSTTGPDGLSLRALAADVRTSTTAVYSLFGGKPGLLRAVYDEAFRRFGERLSTAGTSDDPAEDLVRLGLRYRDSALADPQFYRVMFSGASGVEPGEESRRASARTFSPALDIARRGVETGVFGNDSPEQIALASWGIAHGLVALELRGDLPVDVPVAQVYERSLRALVDGWRR
ncbi:TetR/AcrR family transcriptional regulator [Umezawaea beigongshangensis]|uniref:TetR/AcrR family transcriptional regulator n=1 Tax=Umezawaea beigongshangensis TaxID=2780383 RepID=UPI0018F24120|nr:TetR/AcrR family transcriptional regulator [Umezawaea beigongshangensis]